MNKGLKVILVILIFFAGVLAVGIGFFYAKTLSLQKKIDNTGNSTQTSQSSIAPSTTTAVITPAKTNTVAMAAPTGNRPSNPSDTATVAPGETLMAIGAKAGISWTTLAEANGIDPNKIQAGQIIIIPKNGQISYTINQSVATSLQKDVDAGKFATRLDPIGTAHLDAPTAYGLASTDSYTQTKIDQNSGTATVSVSKNNKMYTISLVQPVAKGAKGIWAIESIKPQ